MIARTTSTLSLALILGLVAGCSDSPETPAPTTASSSATPTPTPSHTFPPQVEVVPGESTLVLWIAVEPSTEPEDTFALTVQQLADVGYDVVPMSLDCQEGAPENFGLAEDPGARGVGLVLSGAEAADDFSMAWNGDIAGWVEGPLLCDQTAG